MCAPRMLRNIVVIVAVLLSTVNDRDRKYVHQECCAIQLYCCCIIEHNEWQG